MTRTAELRLSAAAYRILYAMGGVRVIGVHPPGGQNLFARLRLSDSMLEFARRLEGVEEVAVIDDTSDPRPTPLKRRPRRGGTHVG